MNAAKRQHWLIPVAGIVGLVLVCIGLSLASLSDPHRFPLDATYDRQIGLYLLSGLASTIAGVVVLLVVARRTTTDMSPETRRKANAGVGLTILLQLGGWALGQVWHEFAVVGLAFVAASLPLFVWGCGKYAQGKGRSSRLGALGLLGVLGLIVLVILPRVETTQHLDRPIRATNLETR